MAKQILGCGFNKSTEFKLKSECCWLSSWVEDPADGGCVALQLASRRQWRYIGVCLGFLTGYMQKLLFSLHVCACAYQGRLICSFIFKNYWQLWCYLHWSHRLSRSDSDFSRIVLFQGLWLFIISLIAFTHNYEYNSYCTYANNKNYYPGYMCVLWPLSYSQGVTWEDRLQILRLLLQKVSLWREKKTRRKTHTWLCIFKHVHTPMLTADLMQYVPFNNSNKHLYCFPWRMAWFMRNASDQRYFSSALYQGDGEKADCRGEERETPQSGTWDRSPAHTAPGGQKWHFWI